MQAACVDEAARADVARGVIPDDVPTVGVAVGAVGERVQCRMPKLPKSRRKQRRGVNGTARGEYTDGKVYVSRAGQFLGSACGNSATPAVVAGFDSVLHCQGRLSRDGLTNLDQ